MSSRASRQSASTSILEVSITGVQAVRCLLVLAKERFRECGKTNAYSANIEFNVSAHGEHIRERKAPTENSNSTCKRAVGADLPEPEKKKLKEEKNNF